MIRAALLGLLFLAFSGQAHRNHPRMSDRDQNELHAREAQDTRVIQASLAKEDNLNREIKEMGEELSGKVPERKMKEAVREVKKDPNRVKRNAKFVAQEVCDGKLSFMQERRKLSQCVSYYLPAVKEMKRLTGHLPHVGMVRKCTKSCLDRERPFDCEDCLEAQGGARMR